MNELRIAALKHLFEFHYIHKEQVKYHFVAKGLLF